MSGAIDTVAGPEVDMAEQEAAASAAARQVGGLDLNLEPPSGPGEGLALGLGLGVQDPDGSVPVSRQSWPRFEPGMAGLLSVNVQEDEAAHRTAVSEGLPPRRVPAQRIVLVEAGHARSSETGLERMRCRLLRQRLHRRLATLLNRAEAPASTSSTSATLASAAAVSGGASASSISSNPLVAPEEAHRSLVAPTSLTVDADLCTEATFVESTPAKCVKESAKESEKHSIKEDHAGSHFECNICLEMATEPVVSCCGHLFCWPCLYQWLHVHSLQKECPVCKGSLSDSSVTPIYGRGNVYDCESLSNSIPPRPKAHRLNSQREQAMLDVPASNFIIASAASRIEVATQRNDRDDLHAMQRRVAQTLQHERLMFHQRTLLLRQRLLGRRAHLQSHEASSGSILGLDNPGLDQRTRQNLDTATDSLAIARASLHSLDANMQGLFEVVNLLPRRINASNSTGSGSVEHASSNEQVLSPAAQAGTQEDSSNEEQQQDVADPPPMAGGDWHRSSRGASGSGGVEPGHMHTRKRRRLN